MFSIVIAYRPDNGVRDVQFNWTIQRYKIMFPMADVVVSRDTGIGWDTFCKSRLINKGVDKSKYDNLFIVDIDVVFEKRTIEEAFSMINNYCMIIPMDTLIWLNRGTSMRIINEIPGIKIPKVNTEQQRIEKRIDYRPNGWHIMTKDNYWKAGGYDERFIGWGSEDAAFIKAVVTMCDVPFKRLNDQAFHLWHPVDSKRHLKRDRRSGALIKEYDEAFMDKNKMAELIKRRNQNASFKR